MNITIILFFIACYTPLWCMQDECVLFKNGSEVIKIPSSKIHHFQLLQNLVDQEIKQPIDLDLPLCTKRNTKTLLKIIPNSDTQEINKEYLSKDFKSNLKLAVLSNALVFNKDYHDQLVLRLTKQGITHNSYGDTRKFILKNNNYTSAKRLLLQCVNWESLSTQTLEKHKDSVQALAFNSHNSHIIAGTFGNGINVWLPEQNYTHKKTLMGHTGVCAVALNPHNNHLISGSSDETIKIWDPEKDYTCIQTLNGHKGSVYVLAFNPQTNHLISGSSNKTIKIWNSDKDYTCIQTLNDHTESVLALTFNPHNNHLISGSHDQTIKIWDPEKNYRCIQSLEGHTGGIYAVVFNPHTNHLISGSDDKTIKIWNSEQD